MDKTEIFEIRGKVSVGKIYKMTAQQNVPDTYYFEVIETNKHDCTHRIKYMSKDLKALENKRNAILADIKAKIDRFYHGSTYEGRVIELSLLDKIRSKIKQKGR